jgi:Spore Coat Protein U domain
MKKLALTAALALAGLVSAPVHAATTDNNFNVTVNLTSACLVNTAATALNFGAYTAFGSAATPAPTTSITFRCTRGLTISGVAFDTAGGGNTGVVAGLNYGMSVGTVATAAGTAATASVTGTADVLTYVVTGSMVAGQAGAGAGGAASSARVLTITY